MFQVSENVFQEIMEDALLKIPKAFKDRIENIAFIVEAYPSLHDLEKLNVTNQYHLLGLYSGIPYTSRNTNYSSALPDRIILFQKNIESLCNTRAELESKIKEVLIHEIAHYFGMDEDEVAAAGY